MDVGAEAPRRVEHTLQPCGLGSSHSFRFLTRALPTETKVESGTSQSKNGTYVNLRNSRDLVVRAAKIFGVDVGAEAPRRAELDHLTACEP